MTERRTQTRFAVSGSETIEARVRPGHPARVLNLSPAGALIEVQRPLPPNTYIELQMPDSDRTVVRALVLRSAVTAIDAVNGVTYRAALRFERDYDLGCAVATRDGYLLHGCEAPKRAFDGDEIPAVRQPRSVKAEESLK